MRSVLKRFWRHLKANVPNRKVCHHHDLVGPFMVKEVLVFKTEGMFFGKMTDVYSFALEAICDLRETSSIGDDKGIVYDAKERHLSS